VKGDEGGVGHEGNHTQIWGEEKIPSPSGGRTVADQGATAGKKKREGPTFLSMNRSQWNKKRVKLWKPMRRE